MQAYFTLVRREMGAHFLSWTGYVVIGGVLFLLGFSFTNLLDVLNDQPTERPLTELFYATLYFWLILLLASPLITMRTFALEKYSGTFETLMTAPVSDLQVVLAKFSGALLFYMIMWLPLLPCLLLLRHYCNDPSVLDTATLSTTYLGIFLLGSVYMAVGGFASALTRSQIIAAMLSFAAGISLFLLSFISDSLAVQNGWQGQVVSYLDLSEHMQDFARGMIDTRPVIFCLSLTVFFLFLTLKVVESRRWK